ncbi:MAG: acetylornithine deacetylase [Gemmatimonadota bacterium]|nr:acetylornithine deacetylase [Gemmatimonadota bacterium]MDH5198808.1 acetylornithine deacetylase [Gemmatimonadota bacterium]
MPDLSPIDLLARLVALNTARPNGNLPAIDLLADYLDRPGVRVHRLPSPDEGKANLLIEIGPEPSGDRAGLLLSGHTDVVPADEPEWETDPFQLTERDGKLYGRGAADMKGFVTVAAHLAAGLDLATLRAPLVLLFTYDEEVGTLGARHFAETWSERDRLPRHAIIGEPTRLEVVRAHKGIVELRVTVTGKAAHSGYPHLGQSAIEPAARVVTALAELREGLEAERTEASMSFPAVPFVSLNVGTIRGGAAPNVIPDRCTAEITVRPLPGVETGTLIARVRAVVGAAAGSAPWTLDVVSESPPMLTPPDSPVICALRDVTGQQEPTTVSYATDAGWLQTLGLDCAIFGPGDIATAHRENEFVPIADLVAVRPMLEQVIRHFCMAT